VRAVLDANVLVSALISRLGAPARLVELSLEGEFELVVCRTLLDEVERTLTQPRISKRVASDDAVRFVQLLHELGEVVADPAGAPSTHSVDPGDDYLLALAARERAPLVSGDGDVLALGDRLPISSPREFLEQIERGGAA
jgi:putative PIN family toxin of toxin-antitoxin system